MRKIIALLLTVGMMCALVACGSEQNDINETSVPESAGSAGVISGDGNIGFLWWGSATRGERTTQVLDMFAKQNPGVTFEMQSVAWPDYWNKLSELSESDSLPDCLQVDYSFLEQSVSNEMLIDLTPYLASGVLDLSNVDPGIIGAGSVDGKGYAVCAGVNAPALMYNKTLTDELGIQVRDNMTLEEFYGVARQVYEKTGIKTDMPYGMSFNYLPYILRAQDITKLFGKSSMNVSSAADFEPYFAIYETGVKEGWIIGTDVHENLTDMSVEESPLVYYTAPENQSWCGFFWSNQLTAMTDAAPEEIEIGITTWPSVDPSKSDFLKPGQFFAVSADAGENEETAVRVINYLINSTEANKVLLGERGVPASSVVADAISPLLDKNGQMITKYVGDVVTPNSSPISAADPDGATEVYKYADQLIRRILDGELSASEAAKELYNQGNTLMNQNK